MTDQKHEDREHAQFAPSGAERWTACHLSFHLSQGIESGKSSSYAQEGTECHEAAAEVLAGKPWQEVTKDLSDEQIEIVEEYTDYVFGLIDKLHERYGDKVKVWIEERVYSDLSDDYHGTADTVVYAGRTMEIADLKAGYLPVAPRYEDGKINKQLGSYAILALDTHDLWEKVDRVRMTIVQPRVYREPQTIIVSVDELWEFKKEIKRNITEIVKGSQKAEAGKHCKFCPAKGRCPVLHKSAVEKAKLVFDDNTGEAIPLRLYDPEELIGILNEAETILQHVEGVRQHVRRELEKGRMKGMGWKLVPKRAISKWTDEKGLGKALSGKLSYQEAYNHKLKSPSQIRKLLIKLGHNVDLDPYFVKESSGTTLAPDSDYREEVNHDPFADEG